MTKEAKLQAAIRILPEWVGYDEEIKALQQKVENENRQTEKDSGTPFFLSLALLPICDADTCLSAALYNSSPLVSDTIEDVTKHEEL